MNTKMTNEERWSQLVALDEQLLNGGVILSEWCAIIVRESDIAYANCAFLGAILTAIAGIETYLRTEVGNDTKLRLFDLINQSDLSAELKDELHAIRKYRNKWVHVDTPCDDDFPLNHIDIIENEIEEFAYRSIVALRKTIYSSPFV